MDRSAVLMSLALVLVEGGCRGAPNDTLRARLDSIARTPVEDGTVVGLSVAVTRGDRDLLVAAYGMADLGQERAMSVATPLRLASLTKMITSALSLRLASAGHVSLGTPLVELVPEVRGGLNPRATLDDALRHITGASDYQAADLERLRRTMAPLEEAFVLDQVAHSRPRFEPGAHWDYSNTGYYLAAVLLQRATGLAWNTLVRDSVSVLLAAQSLRPCDQYLDAGTLRGYELSGGHPRASALYEERGIVGDGGLCATASDVASVARRLERGSYLSSSAFRQMTSSTVLGDGTVVDYGMGTRLGTLGGQRLWGHTGGIDAYVAAVMRFPDADVTVVVLQNTMNASNDALVVAWHLAEAALDLAPPELVARGAPQDPSRYAGDFETWGESELPVMTRMVASPKGLARVHLGLPADTVPLLPLGADEFGLGAWPRDRVQFHMAGGKATGYSDYYAGMFAEYHWRSVGDGRRMPN